MIEAVTAVTLISDTRDRCYGLWVQLRTLGKVKLGWQGHTGKARDEGTRRVPSWRETRSGGTRGFHPGLGPDLSPVGEAHIPQSQRTKGTRRGMPSWWGYRSRGTESTHPGMAIFPDLSH